MTRCSSTRRTRWRDEVLYCVLGRRLEATAGAAAEVTFGSIMPCSIWLRQNSIKVSRGCASARKRGEAGIWRWGLTVSTENGKIRRRPSGTPTSNFVGLAAQIGGGGEGNEGGRSNLKLWSTSSMTGQILHPHQIPPAPNIGQCTLMGPGS